MRNCLKVVSIILIIGIILVIAGISGGGNLINLENENLTQIDKEFNENISSLNIKVEFGEVIIKNSDKFKIEASNISEKKLKIEVENDELKVDFKGNNFFGIGIFNYNPKIIIYVPAKFEFKNINIDFGAGSLNATDLISDKTEIRVGAGELKLLNHISNEANINCGVGSVEYRGIINNNAVIDCGVGEIELKLTGNENNYNYELNSGIGEVNINNNVYSGMGNNRTVKNTEENKLFKVKCGIGKVGIKITE